jgi:hypothetical protein
LTGLPSGTITDQQGFRIPGAEVRVIDKSTGLERKTHLNLSGRYNLGARPPCPQIRCSDPTDPFVSGQLADWISDITSPGNLAANILDGASFTALLPLKRLVKTQSYGYVQDEIKLTSRLSLTIGLRYSFFNVFHEKDNRAIPFDLPTCGGCCPQGSIFTNPRKDDLDPRVVALAWSHGQTVFRAGAGIYHSDGQEDDQNLPEANDVQRYSLTAAGSPGLAYPLSPFLSAATGIVTPRDLYRNRKDMYVAAWTASVQRKLGAGILGTIGYLGNKGTGHTNHDLPEHDQPADRRASLSPVRHHLVSLERQQQHFPWVSIECAARLPERLALLRKLHVVALDQRRRYRRR